MFEVKHCFLDLIQIRLHSYVFFILFTETRFELFNLERDSPVLHATRVE